MKKSKPVKLTTATAPNPYKLMGGEKCKIMDALIKDMATKGLHEFIFTVPHKGTFHIKKWDPTITTPYVKYYTHMIIKAV